MHYIFDVKDAEEYGLDEAIMLYNIKYWINLNIANQKNFYDGRTWTYNSVSAFKLLFPFWTEKQIRRILKSLIDKNIIITGNYNKIGYDRTLWYALKDESILPNGQIELTKDENRIDQEVEPIPDINTDINTDKKPIIKYDKKVIVVSNYYWKKCTKPKTLEHLETIPENWIYPIHVLLNDMKINKDQLFHVIDYTFNSKYWRPKINSSASFLKKYDVLSGQAGEYVKTPEDAWATDIV